MDANLTLAGELAACFADPLRFVLFAFPWGEQPDTKLVELQEPWRSRYPGCRYGPDKWACQLLDDIGAEVRKNAFDGRHAVPPLKYAVSSGHGIGKSALTAWLVCWVMATRPNCKGIVTATTANQLETKTWAEIQKWMKKSIVADLFDIQATSIRAKESPESWRVDAITCKEENAEAFAGQHAASSTPFYVFDEASGVPDAIFEVAEGGLTDGEPMMFLFGNPTRNSGRFFNCFHRQSRFWNLRKIDSRTVAITNKRQIEEWKNEYGEDSNFFRVRVRGEFPTIAADQWCDSALVDAAMARGEPPTNSATCAVVGVDVARFGDDDTVICTRIGKDATRFVRYNGLDTIQVVGHVKEEVRRLNRLGLRKVHVFMDEGGVGGGPVDVLRNDGFPVRGVNVSACG